MARTSVVARTAGMRVDLYGKGPASVAVVEIVTQLDIGRGSLPNVCPGGDGRGGGCKNAEGGEEGQLHRELWWLSS